MTSKLKRGRSVSLVPDNIPSKPLKRQAETGPLLSGSGKHSQEESIPSRMVVALEGGKRLQNIVQTKEERQRSDCWNPPLDSDSSSEQAFPHTERSPDGQAEGGKIFPDVKQATEKG